MLYSPKWEVKADPFSLASLIAWLEQQPADGVYRVRPETTCLLGQFAKAMGVRNVGRTSYELGNNDAFAAVAFMHFGRNTYGAALKRARSLIPKV